MSNKRNDSSNALPDTSLKLTVTTVSLFQDLNSASAPRFTLNKPQLDKFVPITFAIFSLNSLSSAVLHVHLDTTRPMLPTLLFLYQHIKQLL